MNKYEWNLEQIKEAVKESINFTEVLEKIGVPRQGNNTKTLKNILISNDIDYSHFTGRARSYETNYIQASEYLDNTKKIKSSKLKEKLLKENLIENKCAICGISMWQDKHITLQLHHIDGNNENNSLENLQLLCPNCHSQTDNYCGTANSNVTKYYCQDCGVEITRGATYCSVCANKHRRKVEDRPSKEQLLTDFKELKSFVKVGKKYGISDNALRKWFSSYDLPTKAKELKNYIENHSGLNPGGPTN